VTQGITIKEKVLNQQKCIIKKFIIMGLGSVKEGSGATFLSIAGGYIWDRKAESTDPNFATQDYEKADKSVGTRQGARYADLTGKVVMVEFRTHQEYGESVNVTVDSKGERYIISISTNNRYSQDMMKALLKYDMDKELFIKPYDFTGADKKRAQGISFRQDGEKLDLKNSDAPSQDAEWFKGTEKKKIKRFFEDLSDWYVGEVEASIIPNFKPLEKTEAKAKAVAPKPVAQEADYYEAEEEEDAVEAPKKAPVKVAAKAAVSEPAVATPLKMKKELRAYISENYEGQELPELSKEALVAWYNLSVKEEELPWGDVEKAQENEVSDSDLDDQLSKLMD
jgi:hypothetical protein